MGFSSSGRHPKGEVIPLSALERDTQDLGIQGEACVPWISGQSPWSGCLISVESQPSPYLLFHSRTVYLAFVLPHP